MLGAEPGADDGVHRTRGAASGLADQTAEGTDEPVMPAAPPFPTFENTPTLPHQTPGNGFESGRDSRAR
ncbi:hypothetical protein AMIS_9140 [Actinoplanes missouriensis 431]|uniref:Uncharacterized protein n=1 Tax=Actinoplanes missouriensis (strain ATCC 14538 / DSM 43046 / CBS 188.64 / JCM 3121 / NBRC 102363 / NCIMB 12654 / NRRL B-3342 / UNCC 431) TaxID=512565 RepID=I0GZE7_ACTM4|nr:hypothetical protein AMIS_9140 [Actinoplanes missouriensis 431]